MNSVIPVLFKGARPMARIYLAIVGLLYLYLAMYCALAPQKASKLVGFSLEPGTGQSEFLTVYGGLEFGLGLIFLLPLLKDAYAEPILLSCLVLHASLVLFRTIGYLSFSGISPGVAYFAIGEWVLMLSSGVIFAISLNKAS